MTNQKLTIIIPTLNNEKTIASSLSSIKDMEAEILIVDMYSDDKTVEIAKTYGAKILYHERAGFAEPGLVLGIEQASNYWILILAADEELPEGLKNEIKNIITKKEIDLAYLPRANFALSGFPRHEAGFPEYHLRLFKKDAIDIRDYKGKIHTFFEPLAKKHFVKINAAFPTICIHHYSNPTVYSYISKINGYTNVEAQQNFRKYPSNFILLFAVFYKPFKAFISHYIKNKSFLDGWRGFWLSIIYSFYQVLILAKIWEINIHSGQFPNEEMANAMIRKQLNLIRH